MTTYTELNLTATPGRRHTFLPKGVTPGSHTGSFTALSVSALPGMRRSFSPKGTAAPITHTGLFTALSVSALPGQIHSFLAKTEYIPPVDDTVIIPIRTDQQMTGSPGAGYVDSLMTASRRDIERWIQRDDEEVLEIISALIRSGILEN